MYTSKSAAALTTTGLALVLVFAHVAMAFATEVEPPLGAGIIYYHYERPTDAHVLVVDRLEAYYELRMMAAEVDRTGTFYTKHVGQLAETHDPPPLAATNGGLWTPEENRGTAENEVVRPAYSLVTNNDPRHVYAGDSAEAILWFGETLEAASQIDGGVYLRNPGDPADLSRYNYAVGSSSRIMVDGKCRRAGLFNYHLWFPRARTAVGVSEDYFVLISTSQLTDNAQITDLCLIFEDFGVRDAVLLDGGRSSSMVIGDTNVNPLASSDREVFHGDARFVANAIGIVPVREQSCDNKIDDDADGLLDCADEPCAGREECREGGPWVLPTYPAGGELFRQHDSISLAWRHRQLGEAVRLSVCQGASRNGAFEGPDHCVRVSNDAPNTGAYVGLLLDSWLGKPGDDWYFCVSTQDSQTGECSEYFSVHAR